MTKLLCGLVCLMGASLFGQYGYVPQSIPGTTAGPTGQVGVMDPNMGMVSNGYGGAPAYGGQQMFGAVSTPANSLLTYGQFEASYSRTTFTNKSIDPTNGVNLGLMAQLFTPAPFFIHATFSWGSSSTNGSSKLDFSNIAIGGGGYLAFSERFHLVGEVGGLYSSLNASRSKLSFTDGALYLHPYLRFAAAQDFELNAGITVTSADNYNARIITLGAYYRLFSQMDVGLNAGFGDETNTYDLGVRFRW